MECLRITDINLANPIAEMTDGGESDIRVVIATVPFRRTYADDAAKIPEVVLLEAKAAAAIPVTDTGT